MVLLSPLQMGWAPHSLWTMETLLGSLLFLSSCTKGTACSIRQSWRTESLPPPALKNNYMDMILKRSTFRCNAMRNCDKLLRKMVTWLDLPLERSVWGFPGGAVVESLPATAGDTGSSPGLGRSHMPRSNWAREPQLLSLRVWSLCSATREAAIVRGPRTAMKSGPHLPQLEKALAQKRRPNTVKNKNK